MKMGRIEIDKTVMLSHLECIQAQPSHIIL